MLTRAVILSMMVLLLNGCKKDEPCDCICSGKGKRNINAPWGKITVGYYLRMNCLDESNVQVDVKKSKFEATEQGDFTNRDKRDTCD